MLPAYPDCSRRSAAKQFPHLVVTAGYELRTLLPSVGAAVGTAVHAAISHGYKVKLDTGELGPIKDGVDVAMASFREEIAPGAEWDDTTPNLMVAEYQVLRMVEAYAPVAQAVTPALVEAEMKAAIAPGWELTGHLDLLDDAGHLDDTKTGALVRPYQAQLGGYALLLKSNGHQVSSMGTTFIRRARKSKPQPPPERTVYDAVTCEKSAWHTIQAIRSDVEKFKATGDPYTFPTNPMSLLCSRKYCPAWGTKFCNLHLSQEDDHGPID